ncbi:MAG TPA: UDP-N-acetylmuramate dehydrogenase [Oscillospiraceae bacterium]|nr:UDP-N-acetylmuramate dehydrogenase [Oscillospiraceae bacterium]HPF55030.1 UDP-N-acetylmuramate dehydrogenase [Clostridiales bacterium]HPK35800.1 UDP-N-acetylmuramate dehydrogenase [Oscillospiraceae bacterium]HPR75420.1 UDP-N-acetylmuramate dehydrogenase [Oscillospiraceae bacterium]
MTGRAAFFCEREKIQYRIDEPLSEHTSFRIGGSAALFAEPDTPEKAAALLGFCTENGIKHTIMGRGSDLLVSDEGYDGVVIRIGEKMGDLSVDKNIITAQAGGSLTGLCRFAQANRLSGLEFAFGIPGSVGGGVYMNAGAYGGELKDVVTEIGYCGADGKVKTLKKEECEFSYRHSFFTDKDLLILWAKFELAQGDGAEIGAKMADISNRRSDKQPLNYPSAGSVFMRPPGFYTGALIEQAGLKGKCIGGAQVSEKHAGFIINTGNATAKDVKELIALIQDEIKCRNGVDLVCEIKFLE